MANRFLTEPELRALAHRQALEVIRRCDELIERTERELSKLTDARSPSLMSLAAFESCTPRWLERLPLVEPPFDCGFPANTN